MRKVAFAWITEWIDFDNEEEAEKYVEDNKYKGWRFELQDYEATANRKYLRHNGGDGSTYCMGNKDVKEFWTVVVEKPYKNYNW